MKSGNIYLERYAWPETGLANRVVGSPQMIVVIPAFCEDHLPDALAALHRCTPPTREVAVLIIVNESENASKEIQQKNQACLLSIQQVIPTFQQHVLHVKLPPKKAGVGLARKIGMDEAVRVFEAHHQDRIIICYDADCRCDENYLQAIEHFYQDTQNNLGLVHYEHELHGPNHDAILNYELYLRYYTNALRVCGYPHALQTLGSCITVRSSAYQKQGGMNTKKAGEDFYFIHKTIPLKGIGEINRTTIYPSDRVSDRVPFGTGHAIGKYLENEADHYSVYHPSTFEPLRAVNANLKSLYQEQKFNPSELPPCLSAFYQENNFEEALSKIFAQSGSYSNFLDRYYQWWDAFRVLKYVHFARDHFFGSVSLQSAMEWLHIQLPDLQLSQKDQLAQLISMREYDRTNTFYIR
ncbi:glycosyltransferase [Marinoscillum sp.]|uniref:glycosyltransferase n=1 Tax=Marinoscillum sp. TaxID=2024838 RepID=UPI003BABE2D4